MENRAIGIRGHGVLATINRQLLCFEERCSRNRQCLIKCANDLINHTLPNYLTGVNGKKVQKEVCLVIPFTCYGFKQAIQMIGSRRPLFTSIDTDNIVIKADNPREPYIIHSIEISQSVEYKKGRKHLTFEELISWCMIADIAPNTAFFSPNSMVGGQIVGLAFDNHKNPKVVTSSVRNGVNMLTRHQEVIV